MLKFCKIVKQIFKNKIYQLFETGETPNYYDNNQIQQKNNIRIKHTSRTAQIVKITT